MSALGGAIVAQGSWLVFLNVLLQQVGVPVPAEPTLLVAGSLAVRGHLSVRGIAAAALLATLLADLVWFAVGRRYGKRALRAVFRLSASPEKYLERTERLFHRWGPAAFAFAKFIPGIPMAGPILAGGLGTTLGTFLLYDLLAMGLWAGTFTTLGAVFQRDIDRALRLLDQAGRWGLIAGAVVVAIAIGVIVRRWQRSRALDLQPRPL